jgi:hypothetical protein
VAPATAADLRLGVLSAGDIKDAEASALASFCARAVAAGAVVVVPDNDALLGSRVFVDGLFACEPAPSLAYGQFCERAGLHVMRAPTADRSETVTGLGGAGVELMVALVGGGAVQAHPMIPMLQVGPGPDADLASAASGLVAIVQETLSRRYRPRAASSGNVRFQLTRGDLGVSL